MYKFFLPIIIILSIHEKSLSQCILFNEVVINAAGNCDGGCNPSTSEWTELYNNCNTPVDISCFVMSDGDFTVTFPAGTIIPANGYLTIGSSNSGGAVNIDLATCNCTSGNSIGTFTNGNEQLMLVDASGVIQDAIYWGSGQFPLNITSSSMGTCNSVTLNEASSANFTQIPASTGCDGCSVGRSNDGSSCWQLNQPANTTLGTTNGSINLNFTASDSIICTGSSIDFTDNSNVNATNWLWTFNGSQTITSTSQNPTNIAYNTSGNYDVTLQVTTSCGVFTSTKNQYIQVGSGLVPLITPTGSLSICQGDSIFLSTNLINGIQWFNNSLPITGATNDTLIASQTGSYTVAATNGTCSAQSQAVSVTVNTSLNASISPSGSTVFCSSDSVVLALSNPNTSWSYQWLKNGMVIPGANNMIYASYSSGLYSLIITTQSGCVDTSNNIQVQKDSLAAPLIASINNIYSICFGQTLQLNAAAGFTSYQWLLNGSPISNANGPSLSVAQTGVYSLVITDANTCSATSLAKPVVVNTLPTISISPSNHQQICEGSSVLFHASSNQSTFQWYNGLTVISGATSADFTTPFAGVYYVKVSDLSGCTSISDTVSVSIIQGDTIQITASHNNVCQGDTITLMVNDLFNQVQWSNNQTQKNIIATESGLYSVKGVNSLGCLSRDSIDIVIYPKPQVDAGVDVYSDCINPVTLLGTGDGNPTWSHNVFVDNTNSLQILVNPDTTTNYVLTIDNGQCKASDTVLVIVDCVTFYMPNTFTPNHDGNNEEFKPVGKGFENYELSIFDRWGVEIFVTDDLEKGWDGTNKNQVVPDGVYFWTLNPIPNKLSNPIPKDKSIGFVQVIH
jgi:gliding motility-associated-like protein